MSVSRSHLFSLQPRVARYLVRAICVHCGLLLLRNKLSETAANQSCRWWDE